MYSGRIVCLSVFVMLAGCVPTGTLYTRLQDEDPTIRSKAAVQAGQLRDISAVPYLIDRLTDTAQAVRMFAAVSLRKITGESMGFHVYDPQKKQSQAVERWRRWWAERRKTTETIQPGEKTER